MPSNKLKKLIEFILKNRTLKQLIEDRNRYDNELSLKTNLHLFEEDWMLVEKKFECLVDELKRRAKWRIEEFLSTEMEGETEVTRLRPRQYLRLDEVLARLGFKEEQKQENKTKRRL